MTLSGKSKLCPGIDIFGNYRGAKNVWIDIQKEWKALECPRVRDLTMTVQETQPRNAWKARRLGDYWIGFTWTTLDLVSILGAAKAGCLYRQRDSLG